MVQRSVCSLGRRVVAIQKILFCFGWNPLYTFSILTIPLLVPPDILFLVCFWQQKMLFRNNKFRRKGCSNRERRENRGRRSRDKPG